MARAVGRERKKDASPLVTKDGSNPLTQSDLSKNNAEASKDSSSKPEVSKTGTVNQHDVVKDAEERANDAASTPKDVSYDDKGANNKNAIGNSPKVSPAGDIDRVPAKDATKSIAKAMMEQRSLPSGLPDAPKPSGYMCNMCMAIFSSEDALTLHMLTHSIGDNTALTSFSISSAVNDFVQSWSHATSTANSKSRLTTDEVDALLLLDSPLLITWDEGICSSFECVPIVPSSTTQDVVSYSWFTSSYNLPTPFPQAAVVRIVLRTNWGSILTTSRQCDVQFMPPTDTNVVHFNAILNAGLTPEGAFNPNTLRMNVLTMALKFVLTNLHLNRNTAFTMDLTSAAPNLSTSQLRVLPSNAEKLTPILYPSRVNIPLHNKTADFVNQCIRDRIGRYDRAQTFSGAIAEWADVYETGDTLTLRIRELWLRRLAQMNLSPADIADAISRCSRHLLTVAAPTAPSVARLMPWRVTTDERQLLQVLTYLNIGTNADFIQPILSAFSSTLARVSPLRINPTLIANAMATIVESTTNTQSPATAILSKLKPVASDFSDFRLACAAWLYNGCAITYLSDDSYPRNGGTITSIDTLVDMFITLIALPLTTDPNSPCKAFMVVANAMVGYENVAMNDPNWTQQRLAPSFNSPSTWPQCFLNPNLIDARRCPVLRWWAETIHRLWPTPSQVEYGAADILGSANIFVPPDVLLLPIQNRPIQITNPTLNLDNELTVWRNAVIDLILRIIDNGRYQPNWNPSIRASMRNAMTNFRIIKSYTPGYMAELLPLELAAIAPTLPFQPFQVPFSRLDVNSVVIHVNVSRQRPDVVAQPALNMPMTQQYTGVPIAVSARPLTVAMLSGEYPIDPPLQTNQWYVNTLTPLYTNEGVFNNAQHAMLASEAYATMISLIAQCSDMAIPMDRPLNWLRQLALAANESSLLGRVVNDLFLKAFDMSNDTILLQAFLESDPRATQMAVSYERYDGRIETFVPQVRESVIVEALMTVERTITCEYNLFGICRGDIICGQHMTESGFNPLAPGVNVIFQRGDPGVFVFGDRSFASFGMNGDEMMVTDEAGVRRPLVGDWVMPIRCIMINISVFPRLLLDRIRKGRLRVRFEIGAFPYVLQYYRGRDQVDGFHLFEGWLNKVTPMGFPPVPFLMPQSEDHNIASGIVTHYLWATEFNDGSLFCTNSDSPTTVFGPDRTIPVERYRLLVDPDAAPATDQLPQTIDFYTSMRRYYLETSPISGVVTTYGEGLPALNV